MENEMILEEIGKAWRQIENVHSYDRRNNINFGAEYETRKFADKWTQVEYIKKGRVLDPTDGKTYIKATILETFRGTHQPRETLTVWNFIQQGTTHPHETPPRSETERTILNELIPGSNGFIVPQPKSEDKPLWHQDPERLAETLGISTGLAVRLKEIFKSLNLDSNMTRKVLHGSTQSACEDCPNKKKNCKKCTWMNRNKSGLKGFDGTVPHGLIAIIKVIDYLDCISKDLEQITEVNPEDALECRNGTLDEDTNLDADYLISAQQEQYDMHFLSDKRDGVKHEFLNKIEHGDWDMIYKTQKEMFWKYKGLTPIQKSQIWECIKTRKTQLAKRGQ
ncbi:MAG: hypothetical protein JRJ85_02545 [Deltaproteobacteria bacterium]|nr:hypothetical protein [Deltaproteobacteria bacterium]